MREWKLRTVTLAFATAPLLATITATVALADDLTVSEWATLPRLIDFACAEVVAASDGCERALLLASETEPDSADLVILPNDLAGGIGAPLAVVRSIAYAGGSFGQRPTLEAAADGSLLIHEEQIAIGRNPWTRTVTVVHSGTAFRIAGLSYSTYDRPGGGGFTCDVDFPNRRWAIRADRVNPETGETTLEVDDTGDLAPAYPTLSQWSYDTPLPQDCAAALTDWFDAAPM
jgi:hypothetical protein